MKKDSTTIKQYKRFKWIDAFIEKNKRFPINEEIKKKFKIQSLSSSHLCLKKYKEQLKICPICKQLFKQL